MRRIMPDRQPVVERIDKLIRDTHDDLQYAIKWQQAYYGLPEQGCIIQLVAYDVSVNVAFHGGADFASPPPLDAPGRSRYTNLNSLEAAEPPDLEYWIAQARPVPRRRGKTKT